MHRTRPHWISRCFVIFVLSALLGACASNNNRVVLPKEKLTTRQVIDQQLAGGSQDVRYRMIRPLALPSETGVSTTLDSIRDLNRDFQRVPNPEIVGYVHPHRASGAPVPGYMTVYKLYDKEHYAQSGEGWIKGR